MNNWVTDTFCWGADWALKPRRGGLFIVPAAPLSNLAFLFFGGAEARHNWFPESRSAPPKNKKTIGRVCWTVYKRATPTGFQQESLNDSLVEAGEVWIRDTLRRLLPGLPIRPLP